MTSLHPHRHLVNQWLASIFAFMVLGAALTGGLAAQTAAPGRAGAPAPGRAGAPAPARGAAQARPATGKPLTKADVEQMWAKGAVEAFRAALKNRGLGFEPDEEWLDALTKKYPAETTGLSAGIKGDLVPSVPPAPALAEVEKEAPGILTRLKDAVQKRSDADLAPLVHPDLLANRAPIYTLFDTTKYRNHSLGKFGDAPYRRVGVQFFQLTSEQVETLHYVQFAMSNGKLVVRDIVTGPAVADLFLRDEQAVAINRLQLVFRALSEKDDRSLRDLFTPGLYNEVTESGITLVNGMPGLPQVTLTPSASMDRKSIRVVVRVSYLTRSNRKVDYDVDFERVANELKVVRLRDARGDVIAFDPNIDNYLNRRYNQPDGPLVDESAVKRTEFVFFQPVDKILQQARSALEDRNGARLREYADIVIDLVPESGYGLRASANYVLGQYEDAESNALRAIESGGTVFFPIQHHVGAGGLAALNITSGGDFAPVVLAVSKERVQYLPTRGQARRDPVDIPVGNIEQLQFERSRLTGQRPFLGMRFTDGKRDSTYNFAAFGTTCPAYADPKTVKSLVQYKGTTICTPAQNGTPVLTLVPAAWDRELNVVLRTIDAARAAKAPAAPARR